VRDAIITFHSLDDTGSVLSYPPADFEALVERILGDGVRVVPLAELLRGPGSGPDRVALTFDDGIRSVREVALPTLRRLRLPATVYVVSDWTGRTNRWPTQPADAPPLALMDWSELGELRDAGIEIGSHGRTHADLASCTEADARAEVEESGRRIEDALQVPVRTFAYPYGRWSPAALAATRAAYASAVTCRLRYLSAGEDAHLLPRIDAYYLKGGWARRALCGPGSRLHLAVRGWLRRLRWGATG
jgi:peptidoglycan/xylan/chitin deacetylase (PgdA/CDA1 family)